MPFCLGIDVSTTAVKALLANERGEVVGVVSTPNPLSTPAPLWSEQDPADWWSGTQRSVQQVLQETGIAADDVVAVGLTGQMHGLTLLDDEGRVLRPAMLWNDQRTEVECEDIRLKLGKQHLIAATGNDALTGFTAPKILWVRKHEPDVYAQVKHILLPKDYIRYKLTGRYGTDKAGAAGTLLLDVTTREWSDTVLEALEIPASWLPPTYEGPAITGTLDETAAAATGLKAGTPVVGGGEDQAAQAVGVGAVAQGIVALTLGTSGVVFATTEDPFIEPEGRLHAFCHAVPGKWHLMGVMLSAAGSLRWFHDSFGAEEAYDTFLAPVELVPPGSEGLLFLPYLTGERTPHPDPHARGAFIGLTTRHTRTHLTRAVLEGVAFGLKDGFELMKAAGLPAVTQVRVSGGGAKSALWRQILASVLNAELVTVNTTEGAALGAALLAGVGAGLWPNIQTACSDVISTTGSTTPAPAEVARYEELYAQYRAAYPALREINQGLSRFDAGG